MMYDLCSVSDAHQRALVLEKRFNRRLAGNWNSSVWTTAGAAPPVHAVIPQPAVPAANRTATAGFKCFKCGEPGHRMSDCKKGDRPGKALFIDQEGIVQDATEGYDQDAIYDDNNGEMEEIECAGDTGSPLLVVQRIKLLPSRESAPVGPNLLARAQMEEEIAESGVAYVLVRKDIGQDQSEAAVPAIIQPLLSKFGDVNWRVTLSLAFQSIGVVYGDIGTSPLYVFSSTFPNGIEHIDDILGVLSLIIYTIIFLPLLKYVFIVLWANDNGDGTHAISPPPSSFYTIDINYFIDLK
ncbi:hypothetical protein Vadar_026921 [Vaccinium darrowii]|uniref:Uncharacterized protein n=1 Tax=Vaccinium darrowii TaxID=229202 RepID=A0ACB7YYV3_9ERIC|nr:hypothetical protein Vadar_026921 [Vaccinium darrowii]